MRPRVKFVCRTAIIWLCSIMIFVSIPLGLYLSGVYSDVEPPILGFRIFLTIGFIVFISPIVCSGAEYLISNLREDMILEEHENLKGINYDL